MPVIFAQQKSGIPTPPPPALYRPKSGAFSFPALLKEVLEELLAFLL